MKYLNQGDQVPNVLYYTSDNKLHEAIVEGLQKGKMQGKTSRPEDSYTSWTNNVWIDPQP